MVVNRESQGENVLLLHQLRELTDGRKQTLLLTVLDADALELARPGDYDALRRLVELG